MIGTASCIGILSLSFAISVGWMNVWVFCAASMLHTMCIGLTIPSANMSALLLFRDRTVFPKAS